MALSINAATTTTRITAVESARQPAIFPVIWDFFLSYVTFKARNNNS
jgi:hypothetical protein